AAIVPVRGEGISTLALSVITSTSGWSSFTASPTFTIQRTISPSAMPSPMSGSFTSKGMGSFRSSLVHEVEAADLGLALVEPAAAGGERRVLARVVALELLVQRLARPAVGDEEALGIGEVLHERDAHEPRRVAEQLAPRSVGAVEGLELLDALGAHAVFPDEDEHQAPPVNATRPPGWC